MKILMIGLGKMGANMTRRLAQHDIEVIGFDKAAPARASISSTKNVTVADSLQNALEQLPLPHIVWSMLPAGTVSQSTFDTLLPLLSPGDIVIDGANAHYKDTLRRAAQFAERKVNLVDAGVSGGIWGLKLGYGLMVGGDAQAVRSVEPLLSALAPPAASKADKTWVHCGDTGSGHYTKMIHNGIEYGLMQAYAEGIALLKEKSEFSLDVAAIAESWRHGTVIRSWLLDLTAEFLKRDASLTDVMPHVADSGEGRWTALEAIELGVPAPVIGAALNVRFGSQGRGDYTDKLLAQMRAGFGGHAVERSSSE